MTETKIDVKSTSDARDFVSVAAAWATSYAQYLTRAASRSARTLELSHQILECVSRGRLSPAALEDSHRGFVDARGREYANELAELSARFFSGLVDLGVGRSQELAALMSPDRSVPELPAPRFDPAHPIAWFEQLAEYAGRLNTIAVEAYQSHLERVAGSEATPSQIQRAAAASLDGLPQHLHRIASLYFELLDGLSDVCSRYEETYLLGGLAPVGGSGGATTFGLHLAGYMGETISASLSLENTRDDRMVIRCSVSDIRRADGVDPAFPSRIAVVPADLELEPGEETQVRLSLGLDEAVYEPDALYVGTLYVLRNGHPRLDVPIGIIATEGPSTQGSR